MEAVYENWFDYEINGKVPFSFIESDILSEIDNFTKITSAIDVCLENNIILEFKVENIKEKAKTLIEKFKTFITALRRKIKEKCIAIIDRLKVLIKSKKSEKDSDAKQKDLKMPIYTLSIDDKILGKGFICEIAEIFFTENQKLVTASTEISIEKTGDDFLIPPLRINDFYNKLLDQISYYEYCMDWCDREAEHYKRNVESSKSGRDFMSEYCDDQECLKRYKKLAEDVNKYSNTARAVDKISSIVSSELSKLNSLLSKDQAE